MDERVKIVEVYFKLKLVTHTQQQFNIDFPVRNRPSRLALTLLLEELKEIECVDNSLFVLASRSRFHKLFQRMSDCELLHGR